MRRGNSSSVAESLVGLYRQSLVDVVFFIDFDAECGDGVDDVGIRRRSMGSRRRRRMEKDDGNQRDGEDEGVLLSASSYCGWLV